MPRGAILSASERASLLALPDTQEGLIRHYTFNDADLATIRQRRGPANRLGFAARLCYLRFPGVILGAGEPPFAPLLRLVSAQLRIPPENWDEYGQREQTQREHLVELQAAYGFESFTLSHYRQALAALAALAWQTDKGLVLARALIENLRGRSVIPPALNAIERVCAEAITRANRRIHAALADPLSDAHRQRLDALLQRREASQTTWLAWLRQPPGKANSRALLEHLARLQAWRALDLPGGGERTAPRNRLLKIAREGGRMTPADLARFEARRRYATLVALAIEGAATLTDEIIDLHDRVVGRLFNAARHRHEAQFQASGQAINEKVRLYGRVGQALLTARQEGCDPFAAIESVLPWEAFAASVSEARQLAQPADFDFPHRLGEGYATLRRYAPEFLDALKLRAAPAAEGLLAAIDVLRAMNADQARKVPADAPTGFSQTIGAVDYWVCYGPAGDAGEVTLRRKSTGAAPQQIDFTYPTDASVQEIDLDSGDGQHAQLLVMNTELSNPHLVRTRPAIRRPLVRPYRRKHEISARWRQRDDLCHAR